MKVLAGFNPLWPVLNLAVARFDLGKNVTVIECLRCTVAEMAVAG
jgi:hypothetical protein